MRGRLFRQLVENDKEPLSIFGTVNAYCSVIAKKNGVKSIYLSGSGVAAASFGLPRPWIYKTRRCGRGC